MNRLLYVTCPSCGNKTEWTPANRFRPFCSERCKTLDLAAWANESYRVAKEESDQGLEPPQDS